MKQLSTIIIALFPGCYLFSQVPLTTSNNTLRHGDLLCKIEVPYVEQGDLQETKKNPSLNLSQMGVVTILFINTDLEMESHLFK